jgi:hypothetical protein
MQGVSIHCQKRAAARRRARWRGRRGNQEHAVPKLSVFRNLIGVRTTNMGRAGRFVRHINAGHVSANAYLKSRYESPFLGVETGLIVAQS